MAGESQRNEEKIPHCCRSMLTAMSWHHSKLLHLCHCCWTDHYVSNMSTSIVSSDSAAKHAARKPAKKASLKPKAVSPHLHDT